MGALVVVTTVGTEEQANLIASRARRPPPRLVRQHRLRRALGLPLAGQDLPRHRVPADRQDARERVSRRSRRRSRSCTATSCPRSSPSRSARAKRTSSPGSAPRSTRTPPSPTKKSARSSTKRTTRKGAGPPSAAGGARRPHPPRSLAPLVQPIRLAPLAWSSGARLDRGERLLEVGEEVVESSMPTEIRTRPSVMPSSARCSAGTEAWVIDAGCEIRVSTPPRLSASDITSTAVEESLGRGVARRASKVISAPKPRRLALLQRRGPGGPGGPDRAPAAPSGAPPGSRRARGRSSRGAPCARASVLMPRSIRKESNGERIAPSDFCTKSNQSPCSGALRDQHAADRVAVAVQELGRRVDDDVGAELERALEVGRHEGVVDRQERAVGVRDLGRAGDVGDLHHRVGRRLDVDHPRLRAASRRGSSPRSVESTQVESTP